ncbi:MAG: HEAT repeat domain-containing protein, partial [Chloroflexia bacterium]
MADRPLGVDLLRRISLYLSRWGRSLFEATRARGHAPKDEVARQEMEAAIAHWVSQLTDPDAPGHKEAVDMLVEIGRPAVPALVQALQSESWLQAFRACEALAAIGDRRAVGPLGRALSHPN